MCWWYYTKKDTKRHWHRIIDTGITKVKRREKEKETTNNEDDLRNTERAVSNIIKKGR
jgi:hypothetical protein